MSRGVYPVVASMLTLIIKNSVSWAIRFTPNEIIKYLYTVKDDYAVADCYQRARMLNDERQYAIAMATICWLTKRQSEKLSCANWSKHTFSIDCNSLVTQP